MYRATGTNAAIGATKSPAILGGGTAVAVRLKELSLYSEGAPGSDAMINVLLRRATALGTSTSVTPGVNSPSSVPAAEATFGSECTVEPTYATGSILPASFNGRSRWSWVAIDDDSQIWVPLTASNGLGAQCAVVGGGTGVLRADMGWRE